MTDRLAGQDKGACCLSFMCFLGLPTELLYLPAVIRWQPLRVGLHGSLALRLHGSRALRPHDQDQHHLSNLALHPNTGLGAMAMLPAHRETSISP